MRLGDGLRQALRPARCPWLAATFIVVPDSAKRRSGIHYLQRRWVSTLRDLARSAGMTAEIMAPQPRAIEESSEVVRKRPVRSRLSTAWEADVLATEPIPDPQQHPVFLQRVVASDRREAAELNRHRGRQFVDDAEL